MATEVSIIVILVAGILILCVGLFYHTFNKRDGVNISVLGMLMIILSLFCLGSYKQGISDGYVMGQRDYARGKIHQVPAFKLTLPKVDTVWLTK